MKRAVFAAAFALAACDGDKSLAVLTSDDPASMTALKAALAKALGRADVELGAGDPTRSSTVAVLPRLSREVDRNTATPIVFEIATAGGKCYVVRRDTRTVTEIVGAACRPLAG